MALVLLGLYLIADASTQIGEGYESDELAQLPEEKARAERLLKRAPTANFMPSPLGMLEAQRKINQWSASREKIRSIGRQVRARARARVCVCVCVWWLWW